MSWPPPKRRYMPTVSYSDECEPEQALVGINGYGVIVTTVGPRLYDGAIGGYQYPEEPFDLYEDGHLILEPYSPAIEDGVQETTLIRWGDIRDIHIH